jgi:hypothetical protein
VNKDVDSFDIVVFVINVMLRLCNKVLYHTTGQKLGISPEVPAFSRLLDFSDIPKKGNGDIKHKYCLIARSGFLSNSSVSAFRVFLSHIKSLGKNPLIRKDFKSSIRLLVGTTGE